MTQDVRQDLRLATVIAGAWFLLALATVTWVFGSPDRTAFQSPDEVITARGAHLVAESGVPRAAAPFDDPTTLARMRNWVLTEDGDHIGSVPATAPYVYGIPRMLPGGGWFLFLLPALGVGLLAGASSLALRRERWLGALVPALAFPALYWMLRPWHNVGLELALASVAGALLVGFARLRRPVLAVAGVAVAMSAALVRPDHVHLLLGLPLIWLVALDGADGRWRRWTMVIAAAAAAWVGGVLLGNLVTTGQAMVSPIDLLDFPSEIRGPGRDLPKPLPQLIIILAPKGWIAPGVVARQLLKYWIQLGPIAPVVAVGLLASTAAALRAWRTRAPLAIAATASMALAVWHALTRISTTDLGASSPDPALVHSYPRYTALVYIAFAIATVVTISRIERPPWRHVAAGVAVLVALGGVTTLFRGPIEVEGFVTLRSALQDADEYAEAVAQLPDDAIVYSRRVDKYVWASHPVAKYQYDRVLAGVGPIAYDLLPTSFLAAIDAGLTPYLLELNPEDVEAMRAALGPAGLRLELVTLDLPPVPGVPVLPTHRVVRAAALDTLATS